MKLVKDLYVAWSLSQQVNFIIALYEHGLSDEAKLYIELLSLNKKYL